MCVATYPPTQLLCTFTSSAVVLRLYGQDIPCICGPLFTYVLGRPRRKWQDNIKMDLQKVTCGGMDCSGFG
jgi:hypothetical protein